MDMIAKCKDQQKCPLQGESSLSNGAEVLREEPWLAGQGGRSPCGQERGDGRRGLGPGCLALA